jgi:hypothetical protein
MHGHALVSQTLAAEPDICFQAKAKNPLALLSPCVIPVSAVALVHAVFTPTVVGVRCQGLLVRCVTLCVVTLCCGVPWVTPCVLHFGYSLVTLWLHSELTLLTVGVPWVTQQRGGSQQAAVRQGAGGGSTGEP